MRYDLQEDIYVLRQIQKKGASILDVGCGEGRYLIPLSASHHVIGVDVNESVIKTLTSKGFHAVHAEKASDIEEKFDYIIMSHILEHLFPLQMLEFVDGFLDMLHDDGVLIVAIPLLYNEFFDDYDHIRPYTPKAIQLLFSDYVQHQKKPRNRLTLQKVWIRKWPHALFHYPGENLAIKAVKLCLNKVFEAAFYLSMRLISRPTGWVGVLRKVSGN